MASRGRPRVRAAPVTGGELFFIVVGAVIGGVLLALGIGSAIHTLPRFSAEFDSSASAATTHVTAPAHWALCAFSRAPARNLHG